MLVESAEAAEETRDLLRVMVGRLGAVIRALWHEVRQAAAVIGTALYVGIWPRCWSRPVRKAFARQVLAIGVEPLWFVGALAMFVGISVVVQVSFWGGMAGQSELLGPLLVAVVARELGPVLINLVVIVRSGSAMTHELGALECKGEICALEEKGLDPFTHLALPRVLGIAVSTFCLTIVFILVALASGYLFAAWLGKGTRDALLFADTVSRAVQSKDVFNILAKSILPALFTGAFCCLGGLGVGGSASRIPQATQRALSRSMVGLFLISTTVSLLTYLRP